MSTARNPANNDRGRRWRRVRVVSCWTAIVSLFVSLVGTVVSMIGTFNDLSAEREAIDTKVMADRIADSLFWLGAAFPIFLVSAIVWLLARGRATKQNTETRFSATTGSR